MTNRIARPAAPPHQLSRRGALLGALAVPAIAWPVTAAAQPASAVSASGASSAPAGELGATLAPPVLPPLPPPPQLSTAQARRFVALRARLDGKPVFAIARGTDEAIVEGRAIAMRGSLILQATRAIDLGNGAWGLPYVETTLATSPTTFEYRTEWENPLTGARQKVSPPGVTLAQLRMEAGGLLSNQLRLPNGLTIDYDGHVALQAGPEGGEWAAQHLHIHIQRAGAAPEDAWVTTTMMQTGRERGGFLPMDSFSNSMRPQIPAPLALGRKGPLVSSFYGRKYATPDALRRTLTPAQRTLLEPFFDQWRGLLP